MKKSLVFSLQSLVCLLLLLTASARAQSPGLTKPITLTWIASSGVVSNYFVERSVGTTNNFTQIAVLGPVTTYSDTNIVDGTWYWYRVRAGNPAGKSDYSNTAGALYLLLPSAVALRVQPLTNSVTLNWEVASGIVSNYYVERSVGTTNNFTQIAVLGPGTTYSDTNLVDGTFYWYRVRAGNPAGKADYSNHAGALYLLLPSKPGTLTITIQ